MMGHYRSEIYSDAELEAERRAEEEEVQQRAKLIQNKIEEKGLARFLAEMRVSTYNGKIIP